MTDAKRYISMTDQAKMIRTSLREALPGTKFSVRQSRGGVAIYVHWHDGPTVSQVNAIVQRYSGGGFDSSQDLAYGVTSYMAGEPVGFIGKYIHTTRHLSTRFIQQRLPRLAARYGVDPQSLRIVGTDPHGCWVDIANAAANPNTTWGDLRNILRDLERYSEAAPLVSATARRVGTYADVPAYVYR